MAEVTDALVILVPVLGRPHRVRPLLDSITAATPPPYRVVFISDHHDTPEQDAILRAGGEMLLVTGNYASKVNAGIAASSEPLIFLGADDLNFHPGWLAAATAALTGPVGLVGTQDLCNQRVIRGEHATHFLMARWYAELGTIDGRPGPLCEDYLHEMVDDELVETARYRGAWAFATDSIVEHLHPMVGKAPTDRLYEQQRARMRYGRTIFHRRAHLWTR